MSATMSTYGIKWQIKRTTASQPTSPTSWNRRTKTAAFGTIRIMHQTKSAARLIPVNQIPGANGMSQAANDVTTTISKAIEIAKLIKIGIQKSFRLLCPSKSENPRQ